MDYEKTMHFDGDTERAFEMAQKTLLPNGFSIVKNTDSSLELQGLSAYWTTGQNPLLGISKVSISKIGNELSIKAEFGGLRKLIKSLIIFILGMAVFFLILFGLLFAKRPGHEPFLILLIFGPWVIIIPLIAKLMKSRICGSLDALLHNMTRP